MLSVYDWLTKMRARSAVAQLSLLSSYWLLLIRGVVVIAVMLAMPTVAHAGEPGDSATSDGVATSVGASQSALPGIGRVAVASPRNVPHAGAALGLGYGFTEAQSGESGSHHRALTSLGLMVQPLRFLSAGLMFDGRYDSHPNDVLGSSSSAVGEPRLIVRGQEAVAKSFAVGAQLSLWVPGAVAPSLKPDASTLDAMLLATYAPADSGLALSLNAGYRLDNSAHVLDGRNRLRLRRGDRISLHLSDFDAMLFGLGASKRLGRDPAATLHHIEVLGDLTWDILLGTNAPTAIESPLRLGLGGRYHLKEDTDDSFGAFQIEGRTEFVLGERPGSAATDALAPIDPRFAFIIGVRWAPGYGPKAKKPTTTTKPGGPGGPGTTTPGAGTNSIRGRVTGSGGEAIANTHVTITVSAEPPVERATDTAADGTFTITELPAGRARVAAKASGYEDASAEVAIGAAAPIVVVDLVMKKTIKQGQLRGLVRSFTGKALAATIKVEPLGLEAKTDADGTFQIDVPPGAYEVIIAAPGFSGQKRPVQVEENGVTILNADLRPGKDNP